MKRMSNSRSMPAPPPAPKIADPENHIDMVNYLKDNLKVIVAGSQEIVLPEEPTEKVVKKEIPRD